MYQPAVRVKHSHDRTPAYRFNREVINAFYCAKIMKRVREDISQLSILDLVHLTCRFEKLLDHLCPATRRPYSQNAARQRSSPIRYVVSRYGAADTLAYRLLGGFFRKRAARSGLARRLESEGRAQIEHILGGISRQCETPSPDVLTDSLEQAAAGVLGRVYGNVYAGRFLNNKLNPRLESFMMPFFQGV
jgi:hypothetical protein